MAERFTLDFTVHVEAADLEAAFEIATKLYLPFQRAAQEIEGVKWVMPVATGKPWRVLSEADEAFIRESVG